MPKIKDFFNRIRSSLFAKKEVVKLESGKFRDLMLSSNLNSQNMNYYEEPLNFNEYCKDFFSVPGNFENQYDYVELISMMQENGSMQEYQTYLDYVKNNPSLYYPSAVHGVDHTSRVVLFAEMLCMLDNLSPHDKNLIMVAAQLHDIGREDDAKNFDHGLASKYKIEQFDLLRNFSNRDKDIIEFAIECHSLEPEQIRKRLKTIPRSDRKDFKKILDYLQDADKLDRTRIANPGWGLDPNRLSSDTAKRLVKVAHQNYFEYTNMMRYQNKINEQDLYGNKLVQYFQLVREEGYNITLDAFSNIVSEYKPGTLEMLYSQGKLKDIFSYDTFQKYRKEESFDDRLNPNRINPDTLYSEITKREQVNLLRETFNLNYMIYHNLKKNNPDAYELFCYVDIDGNNTQIVGAVEVIDINDLEKINQNGYFFRMNDLVRLASKVTPEEYVEIVKIGKIEDLYSSKYCKNQSEIDNLKLCLQEKGIQIDDTLFHQNFRLIQEMEGIIDVLNEPGIEKYSMIEIYSAISKLGDVEHRIRDGKYNTIDYDSKTIIDLLEYTRSIDLSKQLSEEDILDMVEEFTKNSSCVKDPRFVEYTIKNNKPFIAQNSNDILNYREFCADQVLLDPNIDLENAKRTMLNALFTIDVPESQRVRFEKEMMDILYYHQKYLADSDLETTHKTAMDTIRNLFSAKRITDFKDILFESKGLINSYNTDQVGYEMQYYISCFSKKDMSEKLQNTARQIENMPMRMVTATNGQPVAVKVFSGESFYLATSTAMPRCSSYSNKILSDTMPDYGKYSREIYKAMLNTEMVPQEICTSIVSNEMLAHAGSALQDQELIFGYVPLNPEDISIAAMYDMSTKKNKEGKRITQFPTTPRSINDFEKGTTEEHNEVVINNVYPRYIICFDKITDIAIEKKAALEREYKEKGINQPIEILFIDGKEKYIPQIKSNVEKEHAQIRMKLDRGEFTNQDFAEMFERKESNFCLRSLQAIHSTSYSHENWDDNFNQRVLDSMTDILERVSKIVPPEKARDMEEKISMLIERSDRNHGYGTRFYDHSYADSIDSYKLEEIRMGLLDKIQLCERVENRNQITDNRQGQYFEEY